MPVSLPTGGVYVRLPTYGWYMYPGIPWVVYVPGYPMGGVYARFGRVNGVLCPFWEI